MAKNFFEQLLTKAGEIWSGPKAQYDHNIYLEDSSGLSGVAKYLARQEQATKQQEAETLVAHATTSVEKYLARKQQGSAAPQVAQAVQEVPTTGVGKYLARKAAGGSTPVQAPVREPVVIPTTGVGKYLAGMPLTRPAAPAPEAKPAQTAPAESSKTATPAKKTTASAAAKAVKEPAPAKPAKVSAEAEEIAAIPTAHAGGDVIHFENVTQCQARTTKGGQCKNTNHLTKLNRTINKQKYQFVACPQHHNDTFKPYPPFLETH